MTYEEQLNTSEWKNKRDIILKRDGYKCQNCYNRTLVNKFTISLDGIGIIFNKVIFTIFDKESGNTYRCNTPYEMVFQYKLQIKYKDKQSVLALSSGTRNFINLIATLILPEKLDYTNLSRQEKQIKQEKYLKFISDDKFENIEWLDTKGLHIHHKYYQINKNAWEYPDDALQTLCWDCHETLHKNTKIKVMDENGVFIGERIVCDRCYGAGRFPEFSHVQGGICFKCNGTRFQ